MLSQAAFVATDTRCEHGTAGTDADGANMLPSADDPQQADSQQSWPGLFWLPPADDGPNERDMLRVDDELAGLIEAADTPADQHGAHTTRPEAASSVPGWSSLVHSKMAALLALCCVMLC